VCRIKVQIGQREFSAKTTNTFKHWGKIHKLTHTRTRTRTSTCIHTRMRPHNLAQSHTPTSSHSRSPFGRTSIVTKAHGLDVLMPTISPHKIVRTAAAFSSLGRPRDRGNNENRRTQAGWQAHRHTGTQTGKHALLHVRTRTAHPKLLLTVLTYHLHAPQMMTGCHA